MRKHDLLLAIAIAALVTVGCADESTRRTTSAKKAEPADKQPASSQTEVVQADANNAEPPGEGWGSIKGRFVVQGSMAPPEKIVPERDIETCEGHGLVVESVVVGEDNALANAVIYLRSKPSSIHPDFDALKGTAVELDNKNCRFDPHVAAMWTEQKLLLKNSDPIGHNTKADPFANEGFNVQLASGNTEERSLPSPELAPVRVGCNIHPWMGGYVLVRPDPYFAVSAEDGTFEIKNLPSGEGEFQLWQESAGNLVNVKVGNQQADARGRVTLMIRPDEVLDLGVIEVPASAFRQL